jgi:hypothetical protein
MVASAERALRMLVVHAQQGGFYIALVPAVLSEEQVEAALNELGIEGTAVLELGDWKTAACGLTVAFVPPLEAN